MKCIACTTSHSSLKSNYTAYTFLFMFSLPARKWRTVDESWGSCGEELWELWDRARRRQLSVLPEDRGVSIWRQVLFVFSLDVSWSCCTIWVLIEWMYRRFKVVFPHIFVYSPLFRLCESRCSRKHVYPEASPTLMIRGMFTTFGMQQSRRDDYDIDACLEHSEEELQESFLEFYHDVLPELKSVGKVVQFKVRWHQDSQWSTPNYSQLSEVINLYITNILKISKTWFQNKVRVGEKSDCWPVACICRETVVYSHHFITLYDSSCKCFVWFLVDSDLS